METLRIKRKTKMKIVPFEEGSYFHLYNRGNNKGNVFFEQENYTFFLHLMVKYILPIADIYSYCLLPNHFHLIIKIKENNLLPEEYKDEKKNLSQSFSNFFNAYSKAINKKQNRQGSLFQKGFKKIKITKSDYLKNLIIYVNTNSSHHEIEDYKKYKHSSYKALISNDKTSIMRKEVIELFDSIENLKYILEFKKMNLDIIHDLVFED